MSEPTRAACASPDATPFVHFRFALVLVLVLVLVLDARDAAAAEPEEPAFYKGYNYGVQSLYNPIYGILNRGYDALQLRQRRGIQLSTTDVNNVLSNLGDPFPAIRGYGDHGT